MYEHLSNDASEKKLQGYDTPPRISGPTSTPKLPMQADQAERPEKPELQAAGASPTSPRSFVTATRLVRNGGHLIDQLLRLADLLRTRKLARSLERDLKVSRSTVYRYLESLSKFGIGLRKEQVNGCVFYCLPQECKQLLIVQLARVLLADIDPRLTEALRRPVASGGEKTIAQARRPPWYTSTAHR